MTKKEKETCIAYLENAMSQNASRYTIVQDPRYGEVFKATPPRHPLTLSKFIMRVMHEKTLNKRQRKYVIEKAPQ